MLHIIVEILKWIGILLLAILLLVILMLLAVLFVPIRYRVRGRYEEQPDAAVTVSWLLHLIHVKVRYRDALFWQVRIFGIPFLDSKRKKKDKKEKTRRSKKEKKNNQNAEYQDGFTDAGKREASEDPADAVNAEAPEGSMDTEGTEMRKEEPIEETVVSEQDNSETDTEASHGLFAKVKAFFVKLFSFVRAVFRGIAKVFYNIRYTIGKICDKIKNIHDNIGYYHDVITGDEGREAISLIKRELGRLLLHIAPQKFKLDVSFGFDDPATTGQVMAILSMLYPIWSYDISLHPDFENKVMSGHIYMRGRIRVFTLIRIAWRVYFNKNLKKVLVMLQKGGTKHG